MSKSISDILKDYFLTRAGSFGIDLVFLYGRFSAFRSSVAHLHHQQKLRKSISKTGSFKN